MQFSELVQGLFELMEDNLLPVVDIITCQGRIIYVGLTCHYE
jgi:hypothetical protein